MTLLSGCGRQWLAWMIGAAVSLGLARGQTAPSLPASAQAVLVEMADHAAIIFTGEVAAVTRADASGYVDVRFRVDQPVRGVSKNGAYVLREWAGLWTGGAERYRVGQKYLMLLTARGSSGMSAPVGGTDGAIPLAAAGDSPLFKGNGDAPEDKAVEAPEAQVDLRWLAARAQRAAGGTTGMAVRSGGAKSGAVTVRAAGKLAAVLDSGEGSGTSSGSTVGQLEGGRPVASPILGAGDGDESGGGWPGAVAPLPSAGTNLVPGGTYPVATRLSAILTLLSGGSSAHGSR